MKLYPFATTACMLLALAVQNAAVAEIAFQPTWELPSYESVRAEALEWIEKSDAPADQRETMRSLWPQTELRDASGSTLLTRLIETFAIADPQVAHLVEACNARFEGPGLPSAGWLEQAEYPPFQENNLRLYYARWLGQQAYYDEVVQVLEGLKPTDVVDPAGLLFFRTVAHHQLVEPEQSRAALASLLEHESALPRRYLQVAQLLQHDLQKLKDESLDHVARRMSDVRRRLDQGRAGKQVQMVEDSVVGSLNMMIKQLEEQQRQQQSSSSGGSSQSSKPMEDSQLPGMDAPMKVDQKELGNTAGWGDLPPKQREQALQQIGREFPAHYRELIEQYFRDLADESPTDSAP